MGLQMSDDAIARDQVCSITDAEIIDSHFVHCNSNNEFYYFRSFFPMSHT